MRKPKQRAPSPSDDRPASRRSQRRRRKDAVESDSPLKMSEIIEHVGQPIIMRFRKFPDGMQKAILMTVLAWNREVTPADKREEVIDKLLEQYFDADDADFIAVLGWAFEVVARGRRLYYPEVSNFIVDVQFTDEPDGNLYFEVAYTRIDFHSASSE